VTDEEDWYHETCLDLRIGDTQPEGDEDDDETRVLIPSDTYDGLICSACVKDNEYLRGQAGQEGWMTIERVGDLHRVVGRPVSGDVPADEKGPKRERDEETDGDGVGKRVKLEGMTDGDQVSLAMDDKATSGSLDNAQPVQEASGSSEQPARTSPSDQEPRSKGDIFLADGIRERMSKELDVRASNLLR
jgi:E3 ubiquitin-protein ligase UBR7